MTRSEWARQQVAALIDLGDDALDAEEWVARLLALVPEGVDPATYQLTDDDLAALSRVDDAAVQSARVGWYAADFVPARYKRLMDATVRAAETDWDPDLHPRDEGGKFTDGDELALYRKVGELTRRERELVAGGHHLWGGQFRPETVCRVSAGDQGSLRS